MRIETNVLGHCRRAAEAAAPREICGFLATKNDIRGERVVRFYRLRNAAVDPRAGFAFDPDEQARTFEAVERAGLTIVATFHSHVDTSSSPSSTDILNAGDLLGCIYSVSDESFEAFSLDREDEYVLEKLNGVSIMQVAKPANGFIPNPIKSAVLWRVYCYDETQPEDVRVFSSDTHDPADVAERALLALQMRGGSQIDMILGHDKLILDHRGRWKGGSARDVDYQADVLDNPYDVVRDGYWANSATYERIVTLAFADSAFPQPDASIEGLLITGVI